MEETQKITDLLSEAGIQFNEVYDGTDEDCPICCCCNEMAA